MNENNKNKHRKLNFEHGTSLRIRIELLEKSEQNSMEMLPTLTKSIIKIK